MDLASDLYVEEDIKTANSFSFSNIDIRDTHMLHGKILPLLGQQSRSRLHPVLLLSLLHRRIPKERLRMAMVPCCPLGRFRIQLPIHETIPVNKT